MAHPNCVTEYRTCIFKNRSKVFTVELVDKAGAAIATNIASASYAIYEKGTTTAVVEKTTANTLTMDNASSPKKVRVEVPAADTNQLNLAKAYEHEFAVKLTSGTVHTIFKETVVVESAVGTPP